MYCKFDISYIHGKETIVCELYTPYRLYSFLKSVGERNICLPGNFSYSFCLKMKSEVHSCLLIILRLCDPFKHHVPQENVILELKLAIIIMVKMSRCCIY